MQFLHKNLLSILPAGIIMIAPICSLSANDHPILTEENKKQLATLVAKNDYVAVVEINEGKFTGAVMVHNKVKVIANLKGTLRTTHIFSDINPDENALPPAIKAPKSPLPILTPGTYVVIAQGHEIIHSFPGIRIPFLGRGGKPKQSFNYFIQHNGTTHCAWPVGSVEAKHLQTLAKKSVQAP